MKQNHRTILRYLGLAGSQAIEQYKITTYSEYDIPIEDPTRFGLL